jgi:hypothetical protein
MHWFQFLHHRIGLLKSQLVRRYCFHSASNASVESIHPLNATAFQNILWDLPYRRSRCIFPLTFQMYCLCQLFIFSHKLNSNLDANRYRNFLIPIEFPCFFPRSQYFHAFLSISLHIWYMGALCYKPEGRGFDSQWGNFILTTSLPSMSRLSRKVRELRRLTTLWASMACYRASFTFLYDLWNKSAIE